MKKDHLHDMVYFQFSASIPQYRPRVIFKYSFWQLEEFVRPKRQTIMYACIPASSYCSKFPRKYSRQREVTMINHVVIVINRRLEKKWITYVVMIFKCPKVSCTRFIFYNFNIILRGILYLHFERINNFIIGKSMIIKMGISHLCTLIGLKVIITFYKILCL